MPINVNPLHSSTIQRLDNLELVGVQIIVVCDGTTNAVTGIARRHRQVTRDQTGAVTDTGDEITKIFKIADFPAAIQTALNNFVNNVDTKP